MPDHTSLESRRQSTVNNRQLALRELEPGAGAALAVFLAFLHAGIARQEAFLLELLAELQVVLRESARDAVTDRARLSGRAASRNRHVDVEPLRRLRREKRLLDDHLQDVIGEVIVEGAFVDRDGAGPRKHSDARHCALAPPGGSVLVINRQSSSSWPLA